MHNVKNSMWLYPILILMMSWSTLTLAKERDMQINIEVGDKVITATLLDNPTTQEFLSQLPLKLKLEDYNKTEKISDLPKKLTKKDAPGAMNPSKGDIAYYAPWGNLAIFYKDFSVSPGLIKLGRIDSGLEALDIEGPITVTITKANP